MGRDVVKPSCSTLDPRARADEHGNNQLFPDGFDNGFQHIRFYRMHDRNTDRFYLQT